MKNEECGHKDQISQERTNKSQGFFCFFYWLGAVTNAHRPLPLKTSSYLARQPVRVQGLFVFVFGMTPSRMNVCACVFGVCTWGCVCVCVFVAWRHVLACVASQVFES